MVFDAHAYLAMAKADFFLGKCRQRPADVPMTLNLMLAHSCLTTSSMVGIGHSGGRKSVETQCC
jgi:hypothetical protein